MIRYLFGFVLISIVIAITIAFALRKYGWIDKFMSLFNPFNGNDLNSKKKALDNAIKMEEKEINEKLNELSNKEKNLNKIKGK